MRYAQLVKTSDVDGVKRHAILHPAGISDTITADVAGVKWEYRDRNRVTPIPVRTADVVGVK